MPKIFLDENGFAQFEEAIVRAKQRLADSAAAKGRAVEGNTNAWHDNADFDIAKDAEIAAISEIEHLANSRDKIVMVIKGDNRTVADIGDSIEIQLNSLPRSSKFKLTANYTSGDGEISINSPMGSAVYMKKVGDMFSYTVGDRIMKGKLIGLLPDLS
ncbi:MAG: hypothetical protein FWE31_05600 [Firmicutes bacterium]|nr:hypothetical protein [Bacillota bacterium]